MEYMTPKQNIHNNYQQANKLVKPFFNILILRAYKFISISKVTERLSPHDDVCTVKMLTCKESIQVFFLCFGTKISIQSTDMLNDVYTMWTDAIWHAQAVGRKEHPSKRSRYIGTQTLLKEIQKYSV